ncbi:MULTISPECIES: WG repeat-containing protein [Calothrix]|uniref:WG repeat-containing protein n=2 Tax=Calothrix TaxID=1186 RepID=A0ABR8AE07_9CYAN|nr:MULTISPECIES: WG repeat-containing protein [Calothrix]MBD2197994.1 WG repeat-containing protein [Calothrix parietina FACHB-288]MBD2226373.1 WG repeat-containing protein [Calothrix anomala FACHB-343]
MSNSINFSDIQNHWAEKCIRELTKREVINGYPNGTFLPEKTITRAEAAAILMKAFANLPARRNPMQFSDVSPNFWAEQAIEFASAREFFQGYPDGTFKPNELLPRVQAITILVKGVDFKLVQNPDAIQPEFLDDAAEIPDYAKAAIATACQNFLAVNYPNVRRLRPNQPTTRGEFAALICQALFLWNLVPSKYVVGSDIFKIQPQFDAVEGFSDGVAWVQIGKKWGVIDKTGKIIIAPQYYEHYPFSYGLGLVTIGGKYRYIDKTGKIAIAQNVDKAFPFYEGLAAIIVNGKIGYIDTTGKIVIKPQFDSPRGLFGFANFSEGLAAVGYQEKVGFIDKSGKFIIKPQFFWADAFSDGVAFASTGSVFGFIDKSGKFTEVEKLDTVDVSSPFYDGLARFPVNGGYVFINKTGKKAFPIIFPYASNFSEGLAVVSINDKRQFIDTTGKFVLQNKFDSVSDFNDGVAWVSIGEKQSYINRNGNLLIKPRYFAYFNAFSEGLAGVFVGGQLNSQNFVGKWGYVAKTK